MKRSLLSIALAAILALNFSAAHAAKFTYQGNLQDAGKSAEGNYDIELTLYSTAEGGKAIGGPLTMYKVPVHGGTFSTAADFGPLTNVSGSAYLAVKVRSAGSGEFVALSTRALIGTDAVTSCPGSWGIAGNAGNLAGSYLGTQDAQPLIIEVNGTQVANAFLSSGGLVASWLGGGSLNSTLGSNGAVIGGGGSNSTAALANSAGSYCVVGGGTGNQAGASSISYATVAGGNGNKATGYGAAIGGGAGNVASDSYATVTGGFQNTAAGVTSFAAGTHGQANHAGSFVWSDGTSTSAAPFASSGVNQFIVKAGGGVAINGVPKNSGVELSIYPSMTDGYDYSSIFMGQKSVPDGILISSGNLDSDVIGSGLAFDTYDGTTQTRQFAVGPFGAVAGDPSKLVGYGTLEQDALQVVYVNASSGAGIAFYPDATNHLFWDAAAAPNGDFNINQYSNTTGGAALTLSRNFDLHVYANAYKAVAGGWLTGSDARIKNDIRPIESALDTIARVRPVSFHYSAEYRAMKGGLEDKPYLGFIAQEFAEVFPEAVVRTEDHVPDAAPNDPNILALDPNPALITTVAAVQELAANAQASSERITTLEHENATLRSKLDALATRLNRLEGKKGE